MFIKRCIFLCFILLLLTISPVMADDNNHFILIVVPDFSFQEIEYLIESENEFVYTGALAAMNVRPEGSYSYINNMVTLSSGMKATGISKWNSFERGEEIEEQKVEVLQERWTGVIPNRGLLHPYFHQLKEKNHETTHKASIGLLGEMLKKHQIHRYVMGTSDRGTDLTRYGSLFTMDQQGESLGDLLCCVKEKELASYGLEMDEEALLQKIEQLTAKQHATFTVIEWGDLYRLFGEKEEMDYPHFIKKYEQTVNRLVTFVDKVVDNGSNTVMLLSPMMHSDAYKEKKQLAPIWLWGHGDKANVGTLSSETTRQDNIVSNLDVVPTILSSFHMDIPVELSGNSIAYNPNTTENQRSDLIEQLNWIFTVYESRGVVLSSYITLLTIMLLGTTYLLWKKNMHTLWITMGKIVIIAAMSSPFWFLVLSHLLKYTSVGGYFWTLTILSLLSGVIFTKYVPNPLVGLGLLLFATITLDLVTGTSFMQRSYLGYDPIIGARYYGIGNEYAGVYMIASFFVMMPFFRYRWIGHVGILMMFLLLMVLLGAPMWGTNAGATLAAGVAASFVIYLLFLQKKSLWVRMIMGIAVIGLALLFLFILQLFGKGTHISYAFDRLVAGDVVYVMDVIQRKLAMNWKIFKFSNWTQLFVTSYILVGFLLWKFRDKFSSGASKMVFQTGIIASVALLLLNDSGVVAAATSMFLLVSASFYWLLDKKQKEQEALLKL